MNHSFASHLPLQFHPLSSEKYMDLEPYTFNAWLHSGDPKSKPTFTPFFLVPYGAKQMKQICIFSYWETHSRLFSTGRWIRPVKPYIYTQYLLFIQVWYLIK